MIAAVRPMAALLAGAALLLTGSGLLGSTLAVRGQIEGYDHPMLRTTPSALELLPEPHAADPDVGGVQVGRKSA